MFRFIIYQAKQATTKKARGNKKPIQKADVVPAAKPKPSAPKPNAAGSFVRPPKPETAAAPKRKLVQLPVSKKASDTKASPAKKPKLDNKQQQQPTAKSGKPQKPPATKQNQAKSKPISPAASKPKLPAAQLNKKPKNSSQNPATVDAANPFQKKEKINLARVTTKMPKKKPAKPAKKLALADEESDGELAAEVNLFRKKLLQGFSGAREVGGKPDPNAKFSDDDDGSDIGLSDSEDEAPRKRKNAKAEKAQDVKKAAKKTVIGEQPADELKKQPSKKKAVVEAPTDELKKQPSKKTKLAQQPTEESEEEEEEAASAPAANSSFRDKLIGNLKGSRFRFLNEQLYSSEGSSAVKLFKEDRAAFTAYHEGYRQQVQQWPLNPLDRIIKSIKKL